MNVEEWKSQIKRGTLEFGILGLIREKPRYGYEIIQCLERWPILAARESTVSPLLRRLMKDGLLSSHWENIEEGIPPRKYYQLTATGQTYLEYLEREWNGLVTAIDEIRRGGQSTHG